MATYSLKELRERTQRKLADEAEARKTDPVLQELERERIAADIAMGLRDADGQLIWQDTPPTEEEDEEDEDEDDNEF